jgi:hypothetical protein
MSDDLIRLNITAEASGATSTVRDVSNEVTQLDVNLRSSGAAGQEAGRQIAEGMKQAEYSTTEARHAAHLLGEEVGVRVPRALQSVLASSETLGPVLSAAFSTVALIGFIELAKQAGEKLSSWISDTYIFTQADKALNDELTKGNSEILKMNEHVSALQVQIQLMGKSDAQKSSILLGLKGDEITDLQQKILALEDQLSPLTGRVAQARAHMAELAAESGVLSKSLDTALAKEASDRFAKFAAGLMNIAEAADRDKQNLVKLREETDKLNASLASEKWKLMITESEDAQQAEKQLMQTEVQLNGALKDKIALIVQQGEAEQVAAQQQEAALNSVGGRLEAVFNAQTLAKKGWGAMATEAENNLAKIGVALAEHVAISLALDDQRKLSAAKTAAAEAYEATASIPFVGPVLGAAAAASTFATAMAFEQGGVVPSAEFGMVTPGNGSPDGVLSLLHPNEMVLPDNISSTVQDMAAKASGSSGGGDVHIHAMDSQSFETFLRNNPTALSRGINHATRNGHYSPAKGMRGK